MILLGSYSPTTAVAAEVLGTSTSLIGKSSVTVGAAVSGLASGSTAVVYFQGQMGSTWYDIAALAFTTGSVAKQECVAAGPVSADNLLTSLALTDDTAIQGWVPDAIRAVLKTTGTYSAGSVAAYYKPNT